MLTLPEAAKRLKIAKPYLYGIIKGMGILPVIEPCRTDGSRHAARPRKLITLAQFRQVDAQLRRDA